MNEQNSGYERTSEASDVLINKKTLNNFQKKLKKKQLDLAQKNVTPLYSERVKKSDTNKSSDSCPYQ